MLLTYYKCMLCNLMLMRIMLMAMILIFITPTLSFSFPPFARLTNFAIKKIHFIHYIVYDLSFE